MKPVIIWLRSDLRLHDNEALHLAAQTGAPVIPVFILDDNATPPPGAASRFALHQTLHALSDSFTSFGSSIVFRVGSAADELIHLTRETNASAIYWNRVYDPSLIKNDQAITKALESAGVDVHVSAGNLLREPWDNGKADGTPYKVFSAFARSYDLSAAHEELFPAPRKLKPPSSPVSSLPLDALNLLPSIPWTHGIDESWSFDETSARRALRTFIDNSLANYSDTRNFPALDSGISRLSPYLHFGHLSIREVWNAIAAARKELRGASRESAEIFAKELVWREFSHHLLQHFPHLPREPLDVRFNHYPWKRRGSAAEKAWQRGLTGYPIVDAGMRQLWQTGWMHNRVRMIVGSFLVKDLGLPWQAGEEWFWDTLVDADLAQNAMNWQWVAGCGADAAPFFRVFNPVLQGRKFDPDGEYVRRFVPELQHLPARWIHAPWEAPADQLKTASITLGTTYPKPIVDHAAARSEALAAYSKLKN